MAALYEVEVQVEPATSAGSTSSSARSPSRPRHFHLLRQQTRVTYWLAPARRVVLLTVFTKTRSAETAEVQHAVQAQRTCGTTHDVAHDVAHDGYEREGKAR
jgi:hypothetical protein